MKTLIATIAAAAVLLMVACTKSTPVKEPLVERPTTTEGAPEVAPIPQAVAPVEVRLYVDRPAYRDTQARRLRVETSDDESPLVPSSPNMREGESFRLKVRFFDVTPIEGTCTITLQDSSGHSMDDATATVNGTEAGTGLINTVDDDPVTTDRTITATLSSCNIGVPYSIESPNTATVGVRDHDPDTGTQEVPGGTQVGVEPPEPTEPTPTEPTEPEECDPETEQCGEDTEPIDPAFNPITVTAPTIREYYLDSKRISFTTTVTASGELPPGFGFTLRFRAVDSWNTSPSLRRPVEIDFNHLDWLYDDMTVVTIDILNPCCVGGEWDTSGTRTYSLSGFEIVYETRPDGLTGPVAVLSGDPSYSTTIDLPEARVTFSPSERWVDEESDLTFSIAEGATFNVRDDWQENILGDTVASGGTYTIPKCCPKPTFKPQRLRATTRSVTVALNLNWHDYSGVGYTHHVFGPTSKTYYINGTGGNEGPPDEE